MALPSNMFVLNQRGSLSVHDCRGSSVLVMCNYLFGIQQGSEAINWLCVNPRLILRGSRSRRGISYWGDVKYSLEIHHQVYKTHDMRLCSLVSMQVSHGSGGCPDCFCTHPPYGLSVFFEFHLLSKSLALILMDGDSHIH